MKFTVHDIMDLGPCPDYSADRVTELWDGRESLTHREIATLDIPIDDRIWALSRLLWSVSQHSADRCARMFALEVAHLWKCPDVVWWYLATGDAASRDAAWEAAQAAAMAAAWVAMAAAMAAAMASAWASAWAALEAARAARAAWSAGDARAAGDRDAAIKRNLNTLVRAFEVRT